MSNLTESEKTFLECFELVAKKPYMGILLGVLFFIVGMALYSKGMKLNQPGKILFAGIFFGLCFFEIIESYILFRLFQIIEKKEKAGDIPNI